MTHQGTLFLDEVGTMPPAIQPKLLRVLEDGVVRPIGAKSGHKVDVRVASATNKSDDSLRQGLFYRLSRFNLALPPLRARLEDIPGLLHHLLSLFAKEMRRSIPPVSEAAIEQLLTYDFPGNVRELKNIAERALIECNCGAITPEHLVLRIRDNIATPDHGGDVRLGSLEQAELQLI